VLHAAREHALPRFGIRQRHAHRDQAGGRYTDADIIGRIPMARFAAPDDIARAIAFLADTDQSSFINGPTLVVDGGWTADGSWNRCVCASDDLKGLAVFADPNGLLTTTINGRHHVLEPDSGMKLLFVDLPGIDYFAEGERQAALDLDHDTRR
jgi:hypothetical protein